MKIQQFKKLKTINYTVYSPNYTSGESKYYTDIDTLKKAKRIARKLGIGSNIIGQLRLRNKWKDTTTTSLSTIYEFWLEDGYFVKFDFKTKIIDGVRVYKNEIGTRHSLK